MNTKPLAVAIETNLPRLAALAALALLLMLGLTGCRSCQQGSNGCSNIAGVYTLVSVNGKNVPCSLGHDGTAMTVKAGVFTIETNGTCRSLITFSVPPHPEIKREVVASYTCLGEELTMQWKGAGRTKGTIIGNDFTMNNEGMIFRYRK